MSYTNSTPNYGLPQWLAADKPKFLTDINNAFSTIDTQLKNSNDTANTADDNATSALSIAGQAATTAEGAATVAGQAAALAQSVNELVGTLNAKMGTTSIATIGDGTVTGAIDAINDDIGTTSIATIGDGTVTGSIDTIYADYKDNFRIPQQSSDLDDIAHIGDASLAFARFNDSANNVPTSHSGVVLTYRASGDYAVQMAFSLLETSIYTRYKSGSTWTAWRTV